jgi:hypothetical protein
MQWMSAAIIGLALATALPSAWAQQSAAASAGDSSRGLVLQPNTPPAASSGSNSSTTAYGGLVLSPTSTSTGTGSSSGAMGGLVSTTSSQTGASQASNTSEPSPMSQWTPAEKAAFYAAEQTINSSSNNGVNSTAELTASAAAMQLAVPALSNMTLANQASVRASMTDADRAAINLASNIADAQTNLAAANVIYQGAVAAVQLQSQGYTNAADRIAYEDLGINGVGAAQTAADYLATAKAQLDQTQQAYNASWTTFEAQTGISHDQALNVSTQLDNSVVDMETTPVSSTNSTPATDTTASTTPASTNSNSADGASVGGQADAAVAQEIEDVLRDAEASIQVITTSADANSDSNGTAAQQASQAEQAITDAATAAEAASATIANDSAAMTSDQLENTASEYDVTSGDLLSVANLIAIYKGYSVNQAGSSVIQVTSSQVVTPTSVITAPSSQVNVPSMQVNVPSLQIDVPSDQVDMPSDVMSSLNLQPALCGQ